MSQGSDLPEPFTPPDCDLRNFPRMALDVVHLRDSDIAAVADPEAFRCAILLWCASWHQVPAASLPSDDSALARLAGYGRDVRTFRRAKAAGGLSGWVLCSDGRLYHSVIAEIARSSILANLRQRSRTAAATAARMDAKKQQPIEITQNEVDVTLNVTDNVSAYVTSTKGKEKEKGERKKETPMIPLAEKVPPAEPPAGQARPPKAQTVRATRLPADWKPDGEFAAFARSGGLNPVNVGNLFRDYWVAKSGAAATKTDWLATWRNWCRRTTGWREPDAAAAQPTLPVQPVNGQGRPLGDDEPNPKNMFSPVFKRHLSDREQSEFFIQAGL